MNDHDDNMFATEGIAILGLTGRFPGAANVEQFWLNLREGVESISFFSDEELKAEGVSPTLLNDPAYVKAGMVLDGIELFDAPFFGLTPREAELTDPQQRLFMECAWEILEMTGYNPESFEGLIGLYAGMGSNSYLLNNVLSHGGIIKAAGALQISLGNEKDHLATRVSYKLNLKGPSFTVQSACSSSLVAVHVACESLLHYQCDLALAGGTGANVPQRSGYLHQEGSIMSPDGHCRAFDARARGAVAGSGVGLVALKRLEEALADGDQIHAVIRGSAINNDGSSKVGYTAPSVDGQAEVIVTAQTVAGVAASTVSYVEAHGTATPLGDRVEMAALTQAFRASTEACGFCAIGSLKTNIGHLDAAAGVAGLIKTVLALKHKQIPPSLHFEQPNREIDFANSPFYVNNRLSEWETRNGAPRRAGVSSFGIGGTNAHVVVEEAPPAPTVVAAGCRPWQLLSLSARTDTALAASAKNLAEHLTRHPELNLVDVAHTLQVGRKAFNHRLVALCRDRADAADALVSLDPKKVFMGTQRDQRPRVVFMFPGQGAQYVRMGRELYETEGSFALCVDECAELIEPELGLDLRHLLCTEPEQTEEAARQLDQTSITQPALFVIEYALAKLWMEWGVRPHAMIGHSIGEYVAACLSGVFTLEEALRLVTVRGRLLQGLPGGAMLAVALPESELRTLLDPELSIAAVNGPADCVASGSIGAVAELERRLNEGGVSCRRLRVSHAFHSEMVVTVLAPFRAELERVTLQNPRIPFVSNVTGKWLTPHEATNADYWIQQLRHTVRFADGIEELLESGDQVFLEVGPGQTLSSVVKRQLRTGAAQATLSSLPHRDARHSELAHILGSLGQLWLAGAQIDWAGFNLGRRARRVPLPTYPFEHQAYWLAPTGRSSTESAVAEQKKSTEVADWFFVPSWKRTITPGLAAQKALNSRESNWLVFTGGTPLCSRIEKRLEEKGQQVVIVKTGTQFERLSESEYTIQPGRREDYQSLLEELGAERRMPEVIAHLWGTEADDDGLVNRERLARAQDLGFYSLLFLAQALGGQNLKESIHLGIVTSNVQEVTGEETLCPAKATVLGPCKVITQEYQNITCQSIDVVIPKPGTRQETELADLLIAELVAGFPQRVVAYRGRHRWTQDFEAAHLERVVEGDGPLRKGGLYLITGGLSAIGLALAAHLTQMYRAKLVLVDRETLPERRAWTSWLAEHDNEDAVSSKIRNLLVIEEAGAEVLVLNAGTDEQEKMQAAVDAATARWGRINGIIHTEDLLGAGVIQLKSRGAAARVLSPKIDGVVALETIFKDAPPDFIVFFSSVVSHVGGVGQADYCGANSFLDAFAHYKSASSGVRVVTIDWDIWRWDDRQESFVPQIPEIQRQLRLLRQNFGIGLSDALEAVERALASGLPEVVVSMQDFKAIIAKQSSYSAAGLIEQMERQQQSNPARPRSNTGVAYVAPRNEVEQSVTEIWQRLFGIEQVGVEDNFFDLGGHSLLAIQLISQLRETFDVELPINSLFEAQTVANVAAAIAESQIEREFGDIDQLLESIESLSQEEVKKYITEELQSQNAGDLL